MEKLVLEPKTPTGILHPLQLSTFCLLPTVSQVEQRTVDDPILVLRSSLRARMAMQTGITLQSTALQEMGMEAREQLQPACLDSGKVSL